MRYERGDRVIFNETVGFILPPFVPKGTEGTVTKAGWGPNVEVTLENGKRSLSPRTRSARLAAVGAAGGSPI